MTSKNITNSSPGVRLDLYHPGSYRRGRSVFFEAAWVVTQALFIRSFIPGSAHRRWLMRLYGARIGKRVVIKPGVRVKFPWRLSVGDHAWIGEGVWIDNLADVKIGEHCCLSQEAYICTGSHDWSRSTFDLITKPVTLERGSWIAARAVVGPGVNVGEGAVLALGSMASSDLAPWTIYVGSPAKPVQSRIASFEPVPAVTHPHE